MKRLAFAVLFFTVTASLALPPGVAFGASAKAARRRRIIRAVPPPAATASPATSQDTKLTSWLKSLRKRLSQSQARHNELVSVAAVRGSESDEAPPLYWKGRPPAGAADGEDAKQLNAAIDLALKGDTAEAKSRLNGFVATYPTSPYKEDAREMLERLEPPTDETR